MDDSSFEKRAKRPKTAGGPIINASGATTTKIIMDSEMREKLEELRVLQKTMITAECLKNLVWAMINDKIQRCPELVVVSHQYETEDPNMRFAIFCWCEMAPIEVWMTVLEAYPKALDCLSKPSSSTEATLRYLILTYPGNFHHISLLTGEEIYIETSRLELARHIIQTYPESFGLLDSLFRKEGHAEHASEGGAVCSYLFENKIAREYLWASIEQVCGTEKLKEWLGRVDLRFIASDEEFPMDALKSLVSLHGATRVTLHVREDVQRYYNRVVLVEKCWTSNGIEFKVNTNISNNKLSPFHLNNILPAFLNENIPFPPLVSICNANNDLLHYADDCLHEDCFMINPEIASRCHNVEDIFIRVEIFSPSKLLELVSFLETLPSVKKEKFNLAIKPHASLGRPREMNLLHQAFEKLSRVQIFSLAIYLDEDNLTFSEKPFQQFLATTKSLRAMEVLYDVGETLDYFAMALKHNTSIETFSVTYGPETYGIALFTEVLQKHNFTLHSVVIHGDYVPELVHYTSMNFAGRKRLLDPNMTKQEAVEIFRNVKENPAYIPNELDTLYGLLRIRPDIWSC